MKRILYRVLILIALFVAALVAIEELTNKNDKIVMTDMDLPILPIIYINNQNFTHNILRGYTSDIDAGSLRDSITIITPDKNLQLTIDENKSKVKTISYELHSLNDKKIIESKTLKESSLTDKDNKITANINFSSELELDTEYLAKIILSIDDRQVNYYTKLKYMEETDIKNKVNFVYDFHKGTFDKEKSPEISMFLKTKKGVKPAKNLAYVNIYSSLDLVMWSGNSVDKVNEPIPTIKEISGNNTIIELKYTISTNNNNALEYYNVTENYTVSIEKEALKITNFERRVESIFDPKNTDIENNQFRLGTISNIDNKAKWSEDGKYLCFVRERQLWLYDTSANNFIKVFSFEQLDNDYILDNYDQHNIEILGVDNDGNVTYTIYGYMNRGSFEGANGILISKYICSENRNEIKLFIPVKETYQHLKFDLDKFCYLSNDNKLYLVISNTLYAINIEEKAYLVEVSGLRENSYAVSQDKKVIAWQENNSEKENKKIVFLNLAKNIRYTINSTDSERLKLIGFIGNDMLMGLANADTIVEKIDGTIAFPMYSLQIRDSNNFVLKYYSIPNKYVINSSIANGSIELDRVSINKITNNSPANNKITFTDDTLDFIMHNSPEVKPPMEISFIPDKNENMEAWVKINQRVEFDDIPKNIPAKDTLIKDNVYMELEKQDKDFDEYYVYSNGQFVQRYEKLSSAILLAKDLSGTVINNHQQTVWEKTSRSSRKKVADFTIIPQEPELARGSELTSLAMILNYEGIEVDKTQLAKDIIKDTTPYQQQGNFMRFGDANKGFVGDIYDKNQPGYGVNTKPIEDLMGKYLKKEVINLTGCTLDDVLYYVNKETPVWAFISSTMAQVKDTEIRQWFVENGLMEVSYNRLAVVIIGYDRNNVSYADPITGKAVVVKKSEFEEAFNSFGGQAITYIK